MALEQLQWPPASAVELAAGAHIVSYDRRSTIFHAGEAADLLYVLLGGEAKLEFDAGGSATVLMSIASRGQMLGVFAPEGAATAPKPQQLFTACALSRCDVAIIPMARVADVLHRLPAEQLVQILEHCHGPWKHLCCRLLGFLTAGIRRRLTQAIEEIAETFGVPDGCGRRIALRLSHRDLAALVGASRPMVSKHLKELENEGLLAKQHGRFLVFSPDASRTGAAPANRKGPMQAD